MISEEMLFGAKLVVSKKEKYGFLVLSPLGEKIVVSPEWIWAPRWFGTIPTMTKQLSPSYWGGLIKISS